MMIGLAMTALYYNTKLVIVNVLCVISIMIVDNGLLYETAEKSVGYDNIIRMDFVIVMLVLITKWRYGYIRDAKISQINQS